MNEGSSSKDFDIKYLYHLINDTKPGTYYELRDEEYEASMGRDYIELNKIMGNWGRRLHSDGLNLHISELETIFKYGIMTWYINKLIERPQAVLSLRTYRQDIQSGKFRINFYDFKRLMNLYANLDVSIKPKLPSELQKIQKFSNYQLLLRSSGWKYMSFHQYLLMEGILDIYFKFADKINCAIDNSGEFNVILSNDSYDKLLNIDILREMVWFDEIKKLGAVYQRWKIIIEKLEIICQKFDTDNTICTQQKQNIYSRLLFCDRFVTRIQEMIYLMVRQSISTIYEIRDPILEKMNLPIYRELSKWIKNSKNCLNKYDETDLIFKDTDYFFE